ncbi:hypothetical protein OKA06_00845 [Novosphingobium sp. MW5]|nr:hypothetical protein [Novosphingobium sp. MW5]
MNHLADLDDGFTLLEALISLLFSALLAVVVLQLLGADTLQTRRFITRNEDADSSVNAQRVFIEEAGRVRGPASGTKAGKLSIQSNHLILRDDGAETTLYTWRSGRAEFAYSRDGRLWLSATPQAEYGVIRFVWTDGNREVSWWTP